MQAKILSPVPFCAGGYSHFQVLGEFFDYTKYTNTSRAHYNTLYFVRIKMHKSIVIEVKYIICDFG